MLVMYDTVDVSTVPPDPQVVAGYVGGQWPTYAGLVDRFPHAKHVSIAINDQEDADILDVEPLDAVDSQAPAWFRRQKARGLEKPGFYTSVSAAPGLIATLAAAGVTRAEYVLWTAHYTLVPHICSAACGFGFNDVADGTQWTDQALGRNLDESLLRETFFATPRPHDPAHYAWFQTGPFPYAGTTLNERAVVEEYDRLRAQQSRLRHPHRARLSRLRYELGFLHARVDYLIKHEPHQVEDYCHRGWRRAQLYRRLRGDRVVK